MTAKLDEPKLNRAVVYARFHGARRPLSPEDEQVACSLTFGEELDAVLKKSSRCKLLEAALLAVRGPEHVVLVGNPPEVVFQFRDTLINHLFARGIPQEDVARLHGWPSGDLWRMYCALTGIPYPAANKTERARARKMNERIAQKPHKYDWLPSAYIVCLPHIKGKTPKKAEKTKRVKKPKTKAKAKKLPLLPPRHPPIRRGRWAPEPVVEVIRRPYPKPRPS